MDSWLCKIGCHDWVYLNQKVTPFFNLIYDKVCVRCEKVIPASTEQNTKQEAEFTREQDKIKLAREILENTNG